MTSIVPEVPRQIIRGLIILNVSMTVFFFLTGGGSGGAFVLAGAGASAIGLTIGIIAGIRNRTWRLMPGILGCLLFAGWWGLAIVAESAHR